MYTCVWESGLCVCVCACVSARVSSYPVEYLWKPEVNIRCLPLSLHLILWNSFSHWSRELPFSAMLTTQASPRILLSPYTLLPALGLQPHIAMPRFYLSVQDPNSGPHVCSTKHFTHSNNSLLSKLKLYPLSNNPPPHLLTATLYFLLCKFEYSRQLVHRTTHWWSFRDWLISLSILLSRFIRVAAYVRTSSWIILHDVFVPQFIHLFMLWTHIASTFRLIWGMPLWPRVCKYLL